MGVAVVRTVVRSKATEFERIHAEEGCAGAG